MTFKVNVKQKQRQPFPQPSRSQVLVVEDSQGARDLVFRVPSGGDDLFLFVGSNPSMYLFKSRFEEFMNCQNPSHRYRLVGLYNINDMEVTFNA